MKKGVILMMDQKDWDILQEAFQEEEPFWESKYADESEFEGLNLYKWLECEGVRPSGKMTDEFRAHGYSVYAVERDSFGWLIGGVQRMLDPSGKVITFG
jgi:hypothetical protein